MVVGKDDLERITEELDAERVITSPLYCGRCGYNLRSLPYIYRCPECGNEYNARPLQMKGIFLPHTTSVPVGDIIAFLLAGVLATGLVAAGLADGDFVRAVTGLVFAAFAVQAAIQGYRRLIRYLKFRAVYKRIVMEEEE